MIISTITVFPFGNAMVCVKMKLYGSDMPGSLDAVKLLNGFTGAIQLALQTTHSVENFTSHSKFVSCDVCDNFNCYN